MPKKLKICHVITRMIVGGAQENTLYTCRGHLEHGHDVTLITGPSPGPEGKLLANDRPKGLKIIEVPDLVRELSPKKDWRAYKALRLLFHEGKYDVVHTHASKAGIIGRVAASKEGIPLVVHTVHGLPFFKYQNRFINWAYIAAEYYAAKHCDKIYAVAKAMIDQCVAAHVAPRSKYKVVYSGMDLESFVNARPDSVLREKLGIPYGAPVVGTIARLFPFKGHDVLLKAAKKVIAAFPNARFLIIGDGILRKQLEDEITAGGMSANFIFTGLIPPDEVHKYTPLMSVLAHLSLREGLPRAAVQALASAVPVVAYPLDGTPEVVINGITGLLARPEDADDVAKNIIILLRNDAKRREMGRKGQLNVRRLFSWHLMCDILEQDYQTELARKNNDGLEFTPNGTVKR